jgi:hypothetical protein
LEESATQAKGKQAAFSVLTNEDNMNLILLTNLVEKWMEESIDALGKSTTITKLKTTYI